MNSMRLTMGPDGQRCLVVSNFVIDNFSSLLSHSKDTPAVSCVTAPYDQVFQILSNPNDPCWKPDPETALIWTLPEACVPSFKKVTCFQSVSLSVIFEEVDHYATLLSQVSKRLKAVFIPTWALPPDDRGQGMLDMREEIGAANMLMRMNLRLSEKLKPFPNIYLLNTQRWLTLAGKNAFNPKLWYMSKNPFGNEVYAEAAKDMKSALNGLTGNARKLVVLDLDDTLWGGIVGDVGWKHVRLGGHDATGEAFVDFQRALKALTNRGIVLGIVSKNEEAVALEAINRHPEMVLKLKDFAGWQINWQDKAQNIVNLASDLNLGLQSVVFIDDNPAERARVRDALPEVFVPEWPKDKMLYKRALLGLTCFDMPSISEEDAERSRMYATERQRLASKREVGSIEAWLASLEITVKVAALNDMNLQRAAQLLNKTNQMNLTTRRMTELALNQWIQKENHVFWTLRVSDKFGDSGITGLVSLEINGDRGHIVDFVLSCRVFGRKIEEAMLYIAIEHARSHGLKELEATYLPTPKNKPCRDFWQGSGFSTGTSADLFEIPVQRAYSLPTCIHLVREPA